MPTTMTEAIQLATTVSAAEARRPQASSSRHIFLTQVTCFNCNRYGHKAKDCRNKKYNDTKKDSSHSKFKLNSNNNGNKGNKNNIECYSCHKLGHMAKDCWKRSSGHPNAKGSVGASTDLSN